MSVTTYVLSTADHVFWVCWVCGSCVVRVDSRTGAPLYAYRILAVVSTTRRAYRLAACASMMAMLTVWPRRVLGTLPEDGSRVCRDRC
jgi:hypothetical protein